MAFDMTEIIARVRDRAELDATSTLMTSTVLMRMINQALEQVSLEADWPWLRASVSAVTVANTRTIALPTGWIRTLSLVETATGDSLVRRPVRKLDEEVSTGRPYMYAVDGNVLSVAPIPATVYTYTHRYVRSEPVITDATGGVPLIPQVYSQGIVEWAAIKAFQRTKQVDKAATALTDYQQWLTRVRDNVNQGKEPLRVEPRPGAWT